MQIVKAMRIIARSTLIEYYTLNPDSRAALEEWFQKTKRIQILLCASEGFPGRKETNKDCGRSNELRISIHGVADNAEKETFELNWRETSNHEEIH